MIAIFHDYAYLLLFCFYDILDLHNVRMPLQPLKCVYLVIKFSRQAIVQLLLVYYLHCIFFAGFIVDRH